MTDEREKCPLCEHAWRSHDPEDGRCDAGPPCACGRDLLWMRDRIAALSRRALAHAQGAAPARAPSPETGQPERATPPSAQPALDLDGLEALLREGSDRPWHYCDDGETSSCDDEYGRTVAHTAHHDAPHVKNAEANARLIVALVNALPEILTALRRTR